ncbi:YeeE/YedE thiosulfate transporter family protein [Albimonas sp. CAU 1670]|uniref:YeeE/YedE family protein n=1 Tax=Albimonas sp. CAU 1670 TaxID=3032599 RepID=UPI0023DB62A1|nr:YeeE/YedE thiosulfate transporter family protein [Albimonas sp. CAU 1670]MDF2232769.1 YeeE/YedE thiosulfate transporter family protein [Albimonas sp. CAU 1670]
MSPDWILGLLGGALIGAASGLFLLGSGRIAGISGIAGGLVEDLMKGLPGGRAGRLLTAENLLFLVGMALAPALYFLVGGAKEIVVEADAPTLIVAGLLVGFGARLGSGCTSGHGVCGSARLSLRSMAAMGVFMTAAIVTVAVGRLF